VPVYSRFMLCHSIDPCWNRGSRSEDVYGSVEINHSRQWLSSRVYRCWCGKANAINHHKPIGKMFDMVRIPLIFGDFGDGLWMFMALGLPKYTMVEPPGTQSMKLQLGTPGAGAGAPRVLWPSAVDDVVGRRGDCGCTVKSVRLVSDGSGQQRMAKNCLVMLVICHSSIVFARVLE
jgi:hypothetical protein